MRRWIRAKGKILVGLVVALGATTSGARQTTDAAEQKLTTELTALNPAMVDIWVQANQARDRGDHSTAERLYDQVFTSVPSFVHAERRRCGELSALNRRDEAIQLCRDAVSKDASAWNQAALGTVLLRRTPSTEPTDSDSEEAVRLLSRAEELDPDDPYIAVAQCEAALQRKKLAELRGCSSRLEQLAPTQPVTAWSNWVLAMSDGRFEDAERYVERARQNGMPVEAVQKMAEETRANRPWTDVAWRWGLRFVAGWAGLSVLLVLVGSLLSHVTLRTAENWQPDSAKRGAFLRSVYRGVLVVCSLLYYVSLPLVLVLVLATAGGLIYGMFAVGYVPIKLGLIAVVMVGATCWALVKSLFHQTTNEDPGVQIDLSTEPELRRVLDEVAATIGTGSVDKVFLAPSTNLSVFERKGERCLVLGAGVLQGMPLSAFKAILAHEYGHFSNRDTAGGGLALRVRRTLLLFIIGLAQSGNAAWWNPAWLFVTGFYKLFLRVSQGASRLQEILADRRAAEAYGGLAFATGLKHVIACDLRFEAHVNAEIERAVKEKQPLQNLWSPPLGNTDPRELDEALDRKPSPYDSHPAPRDRIRWVEKLEGAVGIPNEAEKDVWSLFKNRDYHERETTLVIYQRLAESGVHPPALPKPGEAPVR